LQHFHLLSEGEEFEGGVASTAEEDADRGEEGEEELRHELTLLTWRRRAFARVEFGVASS
jgi:hypothetical protein